MGYEVDDLQRAQRMPAKQGWATKGAVLALLVAVFLGYAGNFHFVYGQNIVMRKVDKVSWSLSEIVVNLDEVNNLPAFVARARYPLFIEAMKN